MANYGWKIFRSGIYFHFCTKASDIKSMSEQFSTPKVHVFIAPNPFTCSKYQIVVVFPCVCTKHAVDAIH